MSLEFFGTDGTLFWSIADENGYRIYINSERVPLTYSYKDYIKIINSLWKLYLERDISPMLAGYEISKLGLVIETLHCVAPDNWVGNRYPQYSLGEDRENFIEWIIDKRTLAESKLERENSEILFQALEGIAEKNSMIKKYGVTKKL